MPTYDRFLIAPFNTGLQQDLRPWLIMDDAFQTLDNAFVYRGRVRKRFGATSMGNLGQLSSRLRVQVGTLAAPISPVPGTIVTEFNVGQMFSVGPDIFTVVSSAAGPQPMLSTNPLANGTFNITNGAFAIIDPSQVAATPIFWYPALPVMGITQYIKGILNNQLSYAFDTKFAYVFAGGAWSRSGLAEWHGDNLDFFNVCNWQGTTPDIHTMYVTNFNATTPGPAVTDDPIWYTEDGNTWVAMTGGGGINGIYFDPTGARYTGPFVQTCRLIVAFKDRLLLLNTIENDGSGVPGTNRQYVNRCRFSHNGSPLARNAWYEPDSRDTSAAIVAGDNVGDGAGFIDAATEEQIVSVEFIKDRLIVFFERSTWEIAYTGAPYEPFVFQKINTELGSDAQCSSVPFDREILTIGQTGVHSCNGSNCARIDQKIPDFIFDIQDRDLGSQRVAGARDYYAECVYWSYPSEDQNPIFTYPDRILLYNYRNNSWAKYSDVITAFGFWQQNESTTWASTAPLTWQQANFTWESDDDTEDFRQIIAGNQEGFMFVVRPDVSRNAPSLQITDIIITDPADPDPDSTDIATITITAIDHTINFGEYILLENIQGITNINGLIGYVWEVPDKDTLMINLEVPIALAGVYTGGGTIARVSKIYILSKQWNPYAKNGRNLSVGKIDFAVRNTGTIQESVDGELVDLPVGQITVDSFASSSISSSIDNAVSPGTLMGNGVLETGPYLLYPREKFQTTLWHPVYFQTSGSFIQIKIEWNDEQMRDPTSSLAGFEIQGLVLHTQALSNRLE
jgi:hypothetical protein